MGGKAYDHQKASRIKNPDSLEKTNVPSTDEPHPSTQMII
jgi:hypothetical protein